MTRSHRVIQLTYDLIDKGWCRESFAVDSGGVNIHTLSKYACGFCLSGAVTRAAYQTIHPLLDWLDDEVLFNHPLVDEIRDSAELLIQKEIEQTSSSSINMIAFNDGCSSKEPVLKLLDGIIARLR